MSSIGPELPPHLRQNCSSTPPPVGLQLTSSCDDSDDDSDYGPALPPHLLNARAPIVQSGPQPPDSARDEDDSDDDSEVGPMPLPQSSGGSTDTREDVVRRFMEAEERRKKEVEEANKPKAPAREEWMLVPPSASDLLGKLDTSKMMKPRQFSRSTAPSSSKTIDNSLWTETPAERQQRLADEVSGRKRKATSTDVPTQEEAAEDKKKRKRDEYIRREVDEHTRKVRGPALVDSHAVKLKSIPASDEDPSAIWDHSRDMSLGGRLMDDSARMRLLKDAKGLGDRFGSGKSGGYL